MFNPTSFLKESSSKYDTEHVIIIVRTAEHHRLLIGLNMKIWSKRYAVDTGAWGQNLAFSERSAWACSSRQWESRLRSGASCRRQSTSGEALSLPEPRKPRKTVIYQSRKALKCSNISVFKHKKLKKVIKKMFPTWIWNYAVIMIIVNIDFMRIVR